VLRGIFRRLLGRWGRQHWWPARTRFEILVGAVLTQNTRWTGAERAIVRLGHAGALRPEPLMRLQADRLASLIEPAGCPNVKAARLRAATGWLLRHGGFQSLDRIPTDELRPRLLSCHGIGPETADSILLYALGRPVFVVDAYTRRILFRYGLLPRRWTYDRVQQLFHRHLQPEPALYGEYHALLVRLAKTCCRAHNPDCSACPLAD